MSSARIYRFPRPYRRRAVPPPAPVRYGPRPHSRPDAGGFTPLLILTIVSAFLYLSGAAGVSRHDLLYALLLTAIWGVYFLHDKLLRVRVLGPFLARAGQILLFAAATGFFGGLYWLILAGG